MECNNKIILFQTFFSSYQMQTLPFSCWVQYIVNGDFEFLYILIHSTVTI